MSDDQIVTLYWQRDETAIAATEERYGNYLFRIAYNILANREDCCESVNDTYLRAWYSMPPHRPSVLSTYLGKITRQLSIDIYRKRHRAKRKNSEYAISLSELEECVSGGETPEERISARLLGESINCFLRTLSPDARALFVGRYYFMDPLKKVAAYCNMTESKAKSLLFRTRNQLREYLREDGFEV